MKAIETRISEQRFLERLETLCEKKTCFDKEYAFKETFIAKRRGNKFWIGRHIPSGGRGNGYAYDFLFCRYTINESGSVIVKYRFGRHLSTICFFMIPFIFGMSLFIALIYDAIAYGEPQWAGLAISALFWVLGAYCLFFPQKKVRKMLLDRLFRICKIKDDN